jgi:hypothetical protein
LPSTPPNQRHAASRHSTRDKEIRTGLLPECTQEGKFSVAQLDVPQNMGIFTDTVSCGCSMVCTTLHQHLIPEHWVNRKGRHGLKMSLSRGACTAFSGM